MAYTALMTKDEIGFENNTNTITTLEIAEMMEVPHYEILKKLEENENTLQRFALLRSVVYRSAFGGLQSNFDCGILRQRVFDSSMNAPF